MPIKLVFFRVTILVIAFACCPPAHSALRVSGIYSDHVVLQRGQSILVWGECDPGERVELQFAGQKLSAVTDARRTWEIMLLPMKANSSGLDMTIRSAGEHVVLRDVVIGEVWHASGQSNMEMTMAAVAKRLPEAHRHISTADFPEIRFRRISEAGAAQPKKDLPVSEGWRRCSPSTVPNFSAAAFYFARVVHRELNVPVGIIDSSRGGTPIEPYIPREAFASHPTLRRELELGDREDLRGLWKLPGGVRARDQNWLSGRLYHSRLAPIRQFSARGVIWYQAESNCGDREDPRDYQHKMRALIQGWRHALGNEALPFYFVQLPGGGAGPGWPFMREQQRLAADLDHVGMVVTIDLLDADIHPANKVDVGRRLARWALADTYGRNDTPSGPMFQRPEMVGSAIDVHFSHADHGLMVAVKKGLAEPVENNELPLAHFEIADSQGEWHSAHAIVLGRIVRVSAESVSSPVAVRYAYAVNPKECRLYNRDGLPAAPFCSRPELLRYDPDIPAD